MAGRGAQPGRRTRTTNDDEHTPSEKMKESSTRKKLLSVSEWCSSCLSASRSCEVDVITMEGQGVKEVPAVEKCRRCVKTKLSCDLASRGVVHEPRAQLDPIEPQRNDDNLTWAEGRNYRSTWTGLPPSVLDYLDNFSSGFTATFNVHEQTRDGIQAILKALEKQNELFQQSRDASQAITEAMEKQNDLLGQTRDASHAILKAMENHNLLFERFLLTTSKEGDLIRECLVPPRGVRSTPVYF